MSVSIERELEYLRRSFQEFISFVIEPSTFLMVETIFQMLSFRDGSSCRYRPRPYAPRTIGVREWTCSIDLRLALVQDTSTNRRILNRRLPVTAQFSRTRRSTWGAARDYTRLVGPLQPSTLG